MRDHVINPNKKKNVDPEQLKVAIFFFNIK